MQKINNYGIPTTSICIACNAGFLVGKGIWFFVISDYAFLVTALFIALVWGAWGCYLFLRRCDITKVEFIRQLILIAVPLAGTITLLLGVMTGGSI